MTSSDWGEVMILTGMLLMGGALLYLADVWWASVIVGAFLFMGGAYLAKEK